MSSCSAPMHDQCQIVISDNTIEAKSKILAFSRDTKVQLAVERILQNEVVYFNTVSGNTVFPFGQDIIEEVAQTLRNLDQKVVINDEDGSRYQAKGLIPGKTISLLRN